MPSASAGYCGSAATSAAGMSVSNSTCEKCKPPIVAGIPWNTATFPSDSPTYHCRSR